MSEQLSPANGKSCGRCTLCCKVMAVDSLDKPAGAWCTHCLQSSGCAIYEARPNDCRIYMCDWLLSPELGPEWRPDKARFVLETADGGRNTYVNLDPQRPDAWRREPYYSFLKTLALRMPRTGRQILIRNGWHITALLPDEEVDLGILDPEEGVLTERRGSGSFVQFRVFKVAKNDPRLTGLAQRR
jgi:hypothetical protein